MRKSIVYVIILFVVGACNRSSDSNINRLEPALFLDLEVSAAPFIKTNEYIDVLLTDPVALEGISETDKAKLKVAVYRFYKNVKKENGQYVTKLKQGNEINISDKLFTMMTANLKETNNFIMDYQKSGIAIDVPEITPDYLKMLSD